MNAAGRFPTLGERWNAVAALSLGELLAPWDDDDISLPWRLLYSVQRLGDADYFNPGNYWLWEDERLHTDHWMGVSQNASPFRRSAFERVGRQAPISHGIDQALHDALNSTVASVLDPGNRNPRREARPEWFYIYRWGVSPAHVSDDTEGAGHIRYRAIGERPVVPGCYYLHPHWRWEYVEEVGRKLPKSEGSAGHT